MPYVPPGFGAVSHLLRLKSGSMPSGPAVVTYGISTSGSTLQESCDTAAAYFGSVVGNCMSEAWELYETRLQGGSGTGSGGPIVISTNAADGEQTGGAVNPNTAMLVQKRGILGGRSNSGRFYLPGLRLTVVSDNGVIGGTALADYQTALTTFLDGLDTEGIPMYILHSGVGDPTAVTQLVAQAKTATQRRRLR